MGTSRVVQSSVSDEKLVQERQRQIVLAAIKLFADKGYHRTTINDIAKEAGISTGLIYQYFKDKDDVLYLSLMLVLDIYERDLPADLAGLDTPLAQLCQLIRTYCTIIDGVRESSVLAYRSTKSLVPERRVYMMESEQRTNLIIRTCLQACIDEGYLNPVNLDLAVYQYVMFCHSWALKHWAFRDTFTVERYVDEGIKLMVVPHLTEKGRAAFAAIDP